MQSDMNATVYGKWDAVRGDVQKKWGRLTDSDLDQVQGQFTKLVGLIEDKYGYSARKARREVNRFLSQYGVDTGDIQEMTSGALATVRDTASRYPWAVGLAGVVLALVVVGLIWKPFNR